MDEHAVAERHPAEPDLLGELLACSSRFLAIAEGYSSRTCSRSAWSLRGRLAAAELAAVDRDHRHDLAHRGARERLVGVAAAPAA